MRKKDRFRIKRERRRPIKINRSYIFLVFLILYILSLYFLPLGRNLISPKYELDGRITSLCVIKDKIFIASKKEVYMLDGSLKREFPFYILKMKSVGNRLIVTTDKVYILDSSLNILKELSKKDLFPEEIYTFDKAFGIKWRNRKNSDVSFSIYSVKDFEEMGYLKLNNIDINSYTSIFDGGKRILLFKNNGDVIVFNFDGKIIWKKNIRINSSILFNPTGSFYEDKQLIILYWKESIGGKTLLYLLNYDGDIMLKEEIMYGVNSAFICKDSLYILTRNYTVIIGDHANQWKIIPFYNPIYGESKENKYVIVWKIETPVYKNLLLDVDGRKRVFIEGLDGIEITKKGVYLFKKRDIYFLPLKDEE